MGNRLADISGTFESFSEFVISQYLKPFTSPLNITDVRDMLKRAHEEGYKDALKEKEAEVSQEIEDYIRTVTNILNYILSAASNIKDLKIVQARTNFYFGTQWIKAMFIIDTSSEESELSFLRLLNETEAVILRRNNYACELFYINEKNTQIDNYSLNNDYPLIRKSDPV